MRRVLVALLIFCQFSFFAEALDKLEKERDKLEEILELRYIGSVYSDILFKEEQDGLEASLKSKFFYELEYEDIFFEIGSLCNKGNYGIIIGMGFESKYENSCIIYQNCIDLVYYKNNLDLMWTPSVFLGNSMIKIGTGIPFGIGMYFYDDIIDLSMCVGIRPSIKLTIKNISFEAYYQYLMKAFISYDAVKSNQFGLILKISTGTDYQWKYYNWSHYYLE